MKPLRLATWNIASQKDLPAIVARLRAHAVDLCLLQEVSVDPAADLAGLCAGDDHWSFAPALPPSGHGGGRAEYFGLALWSASPLRQAASFQLGPEAADQRGTAETEPRLVQIAVPAHAAGIAVANVHLAPTDDLSPSPVRRAQADRLAAILQPLAARRPVVLGGDFNVLSTSPDLAALRRILPHPAVPVVATYIGAPAPSTIDFFLASVPVAVELDVAPAAGLSDHHLVVATFAFAADPPTDGAELPPAIG